MTMTRSEKPATVKCGCPRNEFGDINCHNCGERVNKRCWNCKTPRGEGTCPNPIPRHRADEQTPPLMGPLLATFDGQPLADVPAVASVVGRALAAAELDAEAARQLEETIRDGPRNRSEMILMLKGEVISPTTPFEVDVEQLDPLPPIGRPLRPNVVFASDEPLVPASGAPGEQIVGIEAGSGRLMARPAVGVWRLTMTGNYPSGSKKAKAKLAKLPRRYHLVFGFANSIGADSFGGNELGTSFWQVLQDRTGWRGMRGLANSAVGSNRIGNGCLWRHDAYRCLDRAHFTIHGLPSGEFDQLDMPVVLLEDKVTGAIHAEVQIHNFARRYSRPWERIKVVGAIIKLVNCLTDAGIPVILRGDFNDSVEVVDELEDNTELHKVAPAERSIDIIFATADIDCRRPAEIAKDTHQKLRRAIDHRSVTAVEHRVVPDESTPRELPRLPRVT